MTPIQNLEDLAFRAGCLGNMGAVLYAGMFEANHASENYDGAMHLYVRSVEDFAKELQECFTAIWDAKPKAAEPDHIGDTSPLQDR